MRNYYVRLLDLQNPSDSASLIKQIGTDIHGVSLMKNKMVHYNLRVGPLPAAAANIIKQEMLSVGGEAAVTRGVINCSAENSDSILSATRKQYRKFCQKLKAQPFSLAQMAGKIEELLLSIEKKEGLIFRCRGLEADLKKHTLIMGVLNVTPDSFSDGNLFLSPNDALEQASRMAVEGADIIDIGGESSRPGAPPVSLEEELDRVIPVIEKIRRDFPNLPISIDTYKSKTADAALLAGADIINDISALGLDQEMAAVAAKNQAWLCLMHMQNTPETMQQDPTYEDLFAEISAYFEERIEIATNAGIERQRLILDPGIGFGKTVTHNLLLLKHLREFTGFNLPLLVGTSRKSFIGKLTGDPVDKRLGGSLASAALAAANGAGIIRVHDVAASKQALTIVDAIANQQR